MAATQSAMTIISMCRFTEAGAYFCQMITFVLFTASLTTLLVFTTFGVYAERKIAGFIQDRLGPTETGPFGLFQTIADLLKLLQKEHIIPLGSDVFLFKAAPAMVFVAVFGAFAVVPLMPGMGASPTSLGVFYLLGIVSLDVIGIMFAGWASNSKYALFGAMRSVAQIVSYEVPVGLSVLAVVIVSHSLDLQVIISQQAGNPDAWISGGLLSWHLFAHPVLIPVFAVFFVASLAEANRAPFDLPEAESELVGGFHTEYSGFRWAMLMLSEYGMMLLMALLAASLFLGGWHSPLPNVGTARLADWTGGHGESVGGMVLGFGWLMGKTLLLVFFQMLARWTYPRLRVDQLMALSWKYLTPISLLLILLTALWTLWIGA